MRAPWFARAWFVNVSGGKVGPPMMLASSARRWDSWRLREGAFLGPSQRPPSVSLVSCRLTVAALGLSWRGLLAGFPGPSAFPGPGRPWEGPGKPKRPQEGPRKALERGRFQQGLTKAPGRPQGGPGRPQGGPKKAPRRPKQGPRKSAGGARPRRAQPPCAAPTRDARAGMGEGYPSDYVI